MKIEYKDGVVEIEYKTINQDNNLANKQEYIIIVAGQNGVENNGELKKQSIVVHSEIALSKLIDGLEKVRKAKDALK